MQGCKTLHGSFHLFIMSRFPGSQIIVRLLLLIPYGTMETFEALLPAYSDRIAQDSHLIPSLTGRFSLPVHSSCFYGILYNTLISHCYQIVKNPADILMISRDREAGRLNCSISPLTVLSQTVSGKSHSRPPQSAQ